MKDSARQQRLVTGLLLVAVLRCATAGQVPNDYLMPVDPEEGLSAVYKKIYEKKLLVTSGEVARYVYLPGLTGTETSVSVYKTANAKRGVTPQYIVTSTTASARLWNRVPGSKAEVPDWRAVRVTRRDAPIPESTASAIHRVWIARLQKMASPPSDEIRGDSSRQIFSATEANGSMLRGETYDFGKKNRMLIELAEDLRKYSATSPSDRPTAAAGIERKAATLLRGDRN